MKIRKSIPKKDRREIRRFERFLKDRATMPKAELYAKHQRYLGLSDEELKHQQEPSA